MRAQNLPLLFEKSQVSPDGGRSDIEQRDDLIDIAIGVILQVIYNCLTALVDIHNELLTFLPALPGDLSVCRCTEHAGSPG